MPIIPFGSPEPYAVLRSYRGREGANASFTWTPTTTGNRQTWAYSRWFRTCRFTNSQSLFSASNGTPVGFDAFLIGDALRVTSSSGGVEMQLDTYAIFRDPTSWYHLLIEFDTTNATASERVRIYVNGTRITSFATASYPALNYQGYVNLNTCVHAIGQFANGGLRFFGGLGAESIFVDGQTPGPFAFGRFVGTAFVPIRYAGSVGGNGHYMEFKDATAATAAAFGKDTAPIDGTHTAANNWTPSGFSVAAGVNFDQSFDTPTSVYSTLDIHSEYGTVGQQGLLDAGLRSSPGDVGMNKGFLTTRPILPGQLRYFEGFFVSTDNGNNGGLGLTPARVVPGEAASSLRWMDGASLRVAGSSAAYGTALSANDVAMCAVRYTDASTCRVWFGRNGTWFGGGDPAANTLPAAAFSPGGVPLFPASYHYTNAAVIAFNFGQRPWHYTPPSGFSAIGDALGASTSASGTFPGNASSFGPVVDIGGTPASLTINGNAVTWGTHALKRATGFRLITSSGSYNAAGSNSFVATGIVPIQPSRRRFNNAQVN